MSTLSAYLFLTLLTSFTSSLPAVPLILPPVSLTPSSPALGLVQSPELSQSRYIDTFLPGPAADQRDCRVDVFPIPDTDLTLHIDPFGPPLDLTDLLSSLQQASNDIKYQIDQSSVNTASIDPWYTHKSADGLVLEVWSRSLSTEGCANLGELRTVIDGLSLYMLQGRQSGAVAFQVTHNQGDTTANVMNRGSIKKHMALPNSLAKREVSKLHLVQNLSTPANIGNLSLSTTDPDDFPIPYTDYSLHFGFFGSQLHLSDLETLLKAVRAEIEEEITAHGRNARLPSEEYSKSVLGFQLWIQKMPWITLDLAWAELAIVVQGLWLYIIDDNHDRETFFDVINHVLNRQIAFGWIGKAHTPLVSLTGAGSRGPGVPASRQTS